MHYGRTLIASALLAAALWAPATAAFAASEPRDVKAARQRADAPKQPQPRPPHETNSCAAFGAGFVRLPGSDSCVRIGGGIDIGGGVAAH